MHLWIHGKFGVDSVLWIKPPRDRFFDPSVIILSLLYIYTYIADYFAHVSCQGCLMERN